MRSRMMVGGDVRLDEMNGALGWNGKNGCCENSFLGHRHTIIAYFKVLRGKCY